MSCTLAAVLVIPAIAVMCLPILSRRVAARLRTSGRNEKSASVIAEETKDTWGDPKLAFEVWKYYGGIGGADKDTMIKIATWLLGLSAAIIGFFATGEVKLLVPAILLGVLGAVVSILAAFVALLYGGYAAWNWAIADRIAEAHKWGIQEPTFSPISQPRWRSALALRLAKPVEGGMAPVFWMFFVAALISLGAHITLLVGTTCNSDGFVVPDAASQVVSERLDAGHSMSTSPDSVSHTKRAF